MRIKQFASILLLTFLCCSVLAVAQEGNPLVNVTGGGSKGTIPLWTGAHKIGNSSMTQDSSGNITSTGYMLGETGVYGSFLESLGQTYSGEGFFSTTTGSGTYNTTNDNGFGSYPVGGQTLYSGATSIEFAFFDSNGNAEFYGDSVGNTTALGLKSAAVPLKNGKMVKVYSQESPQVWFEDFGSARLVGGVATVKLESRFAQLVDTKMPYHVFVTPNGDCHGLYVSQKDRNSFEVRELNGGQSSVEFDYRIAALRLGYEKVRMPLAKMPTMQKIPQRPSLPNR